MRNRDDVKFNPWQLKVREIAAKQGIKTLSELRERYRLRHNGSSYGFEGIQNHWYGDRNNQWLLPRHSTKWVFCELFGMNWETFEKTFGPAIQETKFLKLNIHKQPDFPITVENEDRLKEFVKNNYPCSFCMEPEGKDCITISGKPYDEGFHVPRRSIYRALYKLSKE